MCQFYYILNTEVMVCGGDVLDWNIQWERCFLFFILFSFGLEEEQKVGRTSEKQLGGKQHEEPENFFHISLGKLRVYFDWTKVFICWNSGDKPRWFCWVLFWFLAGLNYDDKIAASVNKVCGLDESNITSYKKICLCRDPFHNIIRHLE